jgi:hypothetical protein
VLALALAMVMAMAMARWVARPGEGRQRMDALGAVGRGWDGMWILEMDALYR